MSSTKGTWDTGEQIRDHKLACSIINLHGTEDAVFDDTNLDLLKRFTDDLSLGNRDGLLGEHGWIDESGSRPGEQAVRKNRSLSGLLIARYGTHEPALDDRDWELLSEWFGKGMPVGEHVER
ncbi:hypothetical protein LTR99_001962 [Exophiala xenobiotica]|uniref:Uncharacterized protein n=1 Tax=Vermiconidia calcicola TaxID=1690605 RepID=A0AAV9Q6A8_9PEZI|nr:hypothetical protein H2202_007401 [Exophiala xenobiotica]KAK5536730.1 hypothetical protein LTR25_005404 [Vermiconidia calcicola]KAK5540372.1 hypothetical protein LTR23_006257 [Chaetothyriales sp. CCFEE 6169]KAK5195440.1 hypothetical protein LTR92_004379 [Exophiala xenobiotica]KAK5211936.1 hypothetical protein LTR41_002178 [Exophiala xenobiotica]